MAGEYSKKVWDYTQPGELIGLKWEDADFKSKTIQICRSMEYRYSAKEWRIGEPKNKSGYRTILLTKEAVAILKKQKKNKRISEISTEWEEFVFLCRKGTPVKNSTYDTALFKICDKAKIPRFSMHILRHTKISMLKSLEIKGILGGNRENEIRHRYLEPILCIAIYFHKCL